MKKNPIFLFIICIFISTGSYAQLSGGVNDGTNYGFTTIPTKPKDLSAIEGSPYYQEEFTLGVVSLEDKKPLEVYMRYDVSNEVVEIKTEKDAKEVYKLPSDKNAEYQIGSDKFVLDKLNYEGEGIYGYFVELYDGKSFRLLKKPSASVTEAVKARTGYGKDKPAKIEINEKYFLLENGTASEIRIKNRIIKKSFTSKEAQDYLSDNKIRSEEDLIQFISHIDKS